MSGAVPSERVGRGIMLGVVAALTLMAAIGLKGEGDFVHFYEGARAVLRGEDLYASGTRGYIYPPLPALVLAPLGVLDRVTAGIVWVACNGLLLCVSVVALASETQRRFLPDSMARWTWRIACLGLLFNLDKARAVLSLGQTDVATFALVVLALRSQRTRPLLCGLALGLAVHIKYQTVVFLPYLLARGAWRESVALVCALIAGLFAGVPFFGWSANLDALARALGGLVEMAGLRARSVDAAAIHPITWDRSVSILSASARASARWGASWITWAVPLASACVCVALGWWMYSRHNTRLMLGRVGEGETRAPRDAIALLEWCGLLTGVLVFSPQSTTRHFFLLTFVTTVCAGLMICSARHRALLIVGVVTFAGGLMLPPGSESFRSAQQAWRAVGGASMCALVLYFAVLWAGLAQVQARGQVEAKTD